MYNDPNTVCKNEMSECFLQEATSLSEVAQRPLQASLSCYSERCDAVGVCWIDCGSGSDQNLADLRVFSGNGLMEGRPALTAPLVHRGTVRQKNVHHVHVFQFTRCKDGELSISHSHPRTSSRFLADLISQLYLYTKEFLCCCCRCLGRRLTPEATGRRAAVHRTRPAATQSAPAASACPLSLDGLQQKEKTPTKQL